MHSTIKRNSHGKGESCMVSFVHIKWPSKYCAFQYLKYHYVQASHIIKVQVNIINRALSAICTNPILREVIRARLVKEFKNCYLKRCENCNLKSVIEKRVFSVYKTKKCVWYHSLTNVFQCSKNIQNVFGTCVYFCKKS